MANPIVELRAVTREYPMGGSRVRGVDNCELAIHSGEFIAVHGPSGSGKSTLCNLIGLLDSPTRGEVYLDGQPVARLRDAALSRLRNRHLGFVFQQFNLIPVLSALENTLLPLQLGRRRDPDGRRRAAELLDRLGLGAHLAHRPSRLSGGQQQRVAIARALISRPRLVIADEPTANLDSATGSEIIGYMSELHREHGVTFIFSTHDETLIARSQRRIALQDGRLVADERDAA